MKSVSALIVALVASTSAAPQCPPEGMMNKVLVNKYDMSDPLSTLSVVQAPIPVPGEGEVLIHMRAMPVDPADFFSILGVYPGFTPETLPGTPGLDGCGVVAQLGPSAGSAFPVGTRVVPMNWPKVQKGEGTFQEYITANAAELVAIPDSVTDASASQTLVNPLTVIGMLEILAPPKGEYVLQAAGGSALGKQLIQTAKHMGYKTISTVRRCEQIEELKGAPYFADEVICEKEDLVARVKEITGGKGAWGAVDPVAGEMTGKLQDSVRDGGSVLVYGALGGMSFTGSVVSTLFRGVSTLGYWVTPNTMKLDSPTRVSKMQEVMDLMATGIMLPHSGKTFSLHEIKEAFTEANRPGRSSDGKAVIVVDPACMSTSLKQEL